MKKLFSGLGREISVILIVLKDGRVPIYAKLVIGLVIVYVLLPIDFLPEVYLPFVGFLDDLVVIPTGLRLAYSMVPPELMSELRERSRRHERKFATYGLIGALVFLAFIALWIWLIVAILSGLVGALF
jgi:uncharacterized membrane protein YkvA (DUF1232 family)